MRRSLKSLYESSPPYTRRLLNISYQCTINFFQHTFKFAKSVAYHAYLFALIGKQFDGLNLGSGSAKIKNFCNIDANPCALCDIVAGIEKVKLGKNSVGIIYNSHVFEHVPREEARKVLAEWYRVIKPGGKLYICVPDLEILFKMYLDNVSLYHTEKGKHVADLACGVTYGGQINKYDFHFYGYSFVTLKDMLESVGFKNVLRFDRSKSEIIPFIDASMAAIDGISISLNVQASK